MRISRFAATFLLLAAVGCEKEPAIPPPNPNPKPADWPSPEQLELGQRLRAAMDQDEGPLPDHLRQEKIPQDQQRMENLRAERLARLRASTVEAYAMVGSRDPKWDKAAVAAMEKVCRAKVVRDLDADAVEAAWEALEEAVNLGCDDPYIRYMHLRYKQQYADRKSSAGKQQRELAEVAGVLRDSKYPAIRRAHAAHNAAVNSLPSPAADDAVAKALESADLKLSRELLVAALKDDARYANEFVELAENVQIFCKRAPDGRRLAYQAFVDALADVKDSEAIRLWLRGQYHYDQGWDARGSAVAALVPEQSMRTFAVELQAARNDFEKAWDLDPSHAEIAVGLLCIAGAEGDTKEVEHWFREAMKVDGDCAKACVAKSNFLQPKWGGHRAALRQFADRLAETDNWYAMLPLIGIEVLGSIPMQGMEYTLADEDWPAAERVLNKFLAIRPQSRWGWSSLADQAGKARRYDIVLRAAEHIGNRPSPLVFDQNTYDALIKKARTAKK